MMLLLVIKEITEKQSQKELPWYQGNSDDAALPSKQGVSDDAAPVIKEITEGQSYK